MVAMLRCPLWPCSGLLFFSNFLLLPLSNPLSSILSHSFPLLPCLFPSLFLPFSPSLSLFSSFPPRVPLPFGLFPLFCPLLLVVVPLVANSSFLSLNRRKLCNNPDLTSVYVCVRARVFASGWDVDIHMHTHTHPLPLRNQKQTDIFRSGFA